jgi:PAS domain S-box-containing protein
MSAGVISPLPLTRPECNREGLLETLTGSCADWLALFDVHCRCLFLNRAISGFEPAAALGVSAEEFAPAEDRARIHEAFNHVVRTGEPRDFEQVVTQPHERGPRYLEWRVRAARDPSGAITGTVASITEVTERRAQRDTLRTQSWILETMREGVVLIDGASGMIRLANPALDRMFGFPMDGLLGMSALPFCHMPKVQSQRLKEHLRSVGDGSAGPNSIQPIEFECERQDGTRFMASCVITPMRMHGTDHWLAVLTDVTERKRLEREITEIANREQQRIGTDLHDGLGQELTGIALMLRGLAVQLQKGSSPLTKDVDDVIALVNNTIQSTRSLARGLTPVNAEHGGLAEALQALGARARDRYGIKVDFASECDGASLLVDDNAATHLYRITQEALTNVMRHSLATQVTIRIGKPRVGEGLELTIEDNGRGFEQRMTDTSDGLGLKIMRYRAQMLGGDFVLEPSASGGTTVRCVFPLS